MIISLIIIIIMIITIPSVVQGCPPALGGAYDQVALRGDEGALW